MSPQKNRVYLFYYYIYFLCSNKTNYFYASSTLRKPSLVDDLLFLTILPVYLLTQTLLLAVVILIKLTAHFGVLHANYGADLIRGRRRDIFTTHVMPNERISQYDRLESPIHNRYSFWFELCCCCYFLVRINIISFSILL